MTEPRALHDVKESCLLARNAIAKLFVDNVVRPRADVRMVAWGQYLDLQRRGLSKQYGIYATSAGVQVLGMHGRDIHSELLEAAYRSLGSTSNLAHPPPRIGTRCGSGPHIGARSDAHHAADGAAHQVAANRWS
jgi:hypothetical protein